jgi:hypothetical protein
MCTYLLELEETNSCKTSTFGNEFVAMKQAMEYAHGLRYKLRMMGMTGDKPTFVFGDNQLVLANTTVPASTLIKGSNAIAYHFIWEGCARDECHTAYVNTNNNVADLLTKPLAGPKRSKFVQMLLHCYVWLRIGEEYDEFERTQTSTCFDFPTFPNGVYGFIYCKELKLWVNLVWQDLQKTETEWDCS